MKKDSNQRCDDFQKMKPGEKKRWSESYFERKGRERRWYDGFIF
jgi:hypothetical protein